MSPEQAAPARTVDPREIAKFSAESAGWWDPEGAFRPLHRLGPARLAYLRDQSCLRFGRDRASLTPLAGLSAIDVGCGGGLVAEPLARMGAAVVGLDADRTAIETARAHADAQGLSIDYRTGDVEQVPERFDLVVALEIVEHVADLPAFVQACAGLAKPGGLVVFSTLNRTLKSLALGVVAAEYLLRWVPRGTHDWRKFIRPADLARVARESGLAVSDTSGLAFDPLSGGFRLAPNDLSVNYFLTAAKD